MSFKIALAQYPIEAFEDFAEYEAKITRWVEEAVHHDAKLLVFPEYGSMELVSLLPKASQKDLQKSLKEMQQFLPKVASLHKKLSKKHNVHILAASFPINGVNTAQLYAPNGKIGVQEKRIMTRFEREEWKVDAGEDLTVFDTALGKIGIAICYDSEFPLLVRALCEAGAEIILVPSCTDSSAGYYRVKVASQARALENQCYVAQSPTVGEAPWSPATDINIGAAGLYGPPDMGFPENGVISEGTMNGIGWIYGEIDLAKVAKVRKSGQVLNFQHWTEQGVNKLAAPAKLVSLK